MEHLEFHFDIVCPFAYLASTQVEALVQRNGATLSWHPVLLGGLLQAHGVDPDFAASEPEAKRRHTYHDAYRWADYHDVPFRWHPRHPLRTLNVMRAILASDPEPKAIHRLFRAYWVENLDLDEDDVLVHVLDEADMDGLAILAETRNPQVKQRLREVGIAAAGRGIFGVPTFVVRDTIVWGQDRLPMVERVLQGGTL